MLEVSESVLQGAKAHLVVLRNKWKTGLCHGAVFYTDGTEIGRCAAHGACHSWASSGYSDYTNKGEDFLVLNCHPNKRVVSCEQSSADALALWLAQESPYSQYILNRDDKESLLNGGMILYCSYSGTDGLTDAQMLWICKVLRYAVEGSASIDAWKALYDGGVDPLLAILIATHHSYFDGAFFGYSAVTDHVAVFNRQYHGGDNVENILNRTTTRSGSTYGIFGASKTDQVRDKLRTFSTPVMRDDGWGGKVKSAEASRDLFVQRALEWEDSLRKELKIPKNIVTPVSPSTIYLDVDL
jgi:hypothetical protein